MKSQQNIIELVARPVECQALEMTFFDPGCDKCMKEMTSPSHVLAVLRQWVPQVQQATEKLFAVAVNKMGLHPDDRYSLSFFDS